MKLIGLNFRYRILVTYYEGFNFCRFKTKQFKTYEDYDDFCCTANVSIVTAYFAVVDLYNQQVCGVPIIPNRRDSFESSVLPLLYNHGIKFKF